MNAKLNSFCLTTYYYLCVAYYFLPANFKLYFGAIFLLYASFLVLKIRCISIKEFHLFSLFLYLFVLIQLINTRFLFSVFYLVSNLCLLCYIVHSTFNVRILYRLFYLFSLCFFIFAMKGISVDYLLDDVSRNFISVFFQVYLCLIYAISIIQKEKIVVFPAIISLFFAFWAVGRSGIICISLLVLYLLIRILRKQSKILQCAIVMLLLLLITYVICCIDFKALSSNSEVLYRLMNQGINSPERDELKWKYLDAMNLKTLLLGYNYSLDPLFIIFRDNPHNSYIRFHYSVGFLFFIFMGFVLVVLFRFWNNNRFLFIMLVALLLRGWTDIVFFMDKFDFVVFLLLYMGYKYKTSNPIKYEIGFFLF